MSRMGEEASPEVSYGILGPLTVIERGTSVDITSAKQRRVLVALLLEAGSAVSVDRLEYVLWGDALPKTARKTVHTLISRLRGRLGAGRIETHPEGYALAGANPVVDARRFEEMVERSATLGPADALVQLDAALGMWRGDALVEFRGEEFAAPEARRLDELRLVAREERFNALMAISDLNRALPELEVYVGQHPYRERPHAQLMAALSRAGRVPEALAAYRVYRTRLAEELGLEPSTALQELELRILTSDDSVAPDVGSRSSIDVARVAPVPVAATRLIGRAAELAAIHQALEASRVVTIVGPPGVGKTRLASDFATSHADISEVRWADLVGAHECCPVGAWLMAGLGLRTRAGIDAVDQLAEALAGRDMLLVLDNCDHLARDVAHLVDVLVRRGPSIRVLATSREQLGIAAEHLVQLDPLPWVSEGRAGIAPALELFAERARAVDPGFKLDGATLPAVESICRQVEGLPLAIELLAADLRAFSPAEVASRLSSYLAEVSTRSAQGRQQALDTAIECSYARLQPDEQALFDDLSIFAGGFDLAAAAAVADGEVDVPGLVRGLVDRSLVSADHSRPNTRYRILMPLRAFASRRLHATGRYPKVARRHAQWALELVQRIKPDLRGRHEAEAVEAIDIELPNLRAAHRYVSTVGEVDLALELTSALHTYAFLRMRDEIFTWTEAAVAMDGAHAHPLYAVAAGSLALGLALRWDLERAEMYARTGLAANGSTIEALDALAVVALERGDLSSAIRWAKDLEREATAAGDDYFLAFSHLTRFVAHLEDDDRVAAGVHQRRFAELAFDLGNPTLMAWAHLSEGEFLLAEDVASASRLFDDAIAMGSSVGNDLVVGLALSAMATSHAEQGLVPAAISVFVQTVEHWLERADWAHQFATLRSVVSFLGRIGQTEFAAELLGAVRQGYADLTPAGSAMAQLTDSAASLEASLGRERFRRLVASGRRLTRHETVALAQRALGEASADLGMDPEVAVLANLVHLSDADRTLSLHRA